MYDVLLRISVQANREFTAVLRERETANANHFENLYGQAFCPLHNQKRSKLAAWGIGNGAPGPLSLPLAQMQPEAAKVFQEQEPSAFRRDRGQPTAKPWVKGG